MATVPNLDKWIAAALVETEHDAADLEALIKEITDTIAKITAEVAHASKELLDPQNHGYIATKTHIDTANVMLARFNVSLPKLQDMHRQAVARDELAKWNDDLAKLVVIRNEVSARFRERYCAIGDELVSLFDEVVATDQLIEALHVRAPPGTPRMRTTEAHSRGVERIGGTTKSILAEAVLPSFGLGSGTVPAAWPRSKEPWNLELMRAMQPLFTGPPMDPQLVAEANLEVEASGGTVIFGEAYRRALERRQQAQSEAWAEQGRERERQKEAAQAEERNRQREAAMERRRQGM